MPKNRISANGKIPPPSRKDMISVLQLDGFTPERTPGDHLVFKKDDMIVQVDMGRISEQLGQDSFHLIMARARMSRERYVALLKRL
ncbi:MAG: hypothetical protein KGI04_02925 [Candidatus Micrarchaeota archaeon]|nr:hypothetical protein [Candidatus Micrarchaeota archaeon]